MTSSCLIKILPVILRTANSPRTIATSSCSNIRMKRRWKTLEPEVRCQPFVEQDDDNDSIESIAPSQSTTELSEDFWSHPCHEPKNRSQELHTLYESANKRKDTVIVFPGFGSQYIGMCSKQKDPNTLKLFDQASSILGYDLLDVCQNGPKSKLSDIKYQEPAIFVTSVAALHKLEQTNPEAIHNCVGTCGYSVGQITAMYFAGCFNFESALRAIEVRTEAIEVASQINAGGMLLAATQHDSKLSFACSIARQFIQEQNRDSERIIDCQVSCLLHPDLRIVSGSIEALSFIAKRQDEFKIKVRRIDTPVALHSKLMTPAIQIIREALSSIRVRNPEIPIFSTKFDFVQNIGNVLDEIAHQPVRKINWESLLHKVYSRKQGEEFPSTYECGPGNFLTSILHKVNAKAANLSQNIQV